MGLFGGDSDDICERMCAHPKLKKSRRYQTLMWHLCKERRDETYSIDKKMAKEVGFLFKK
jgi:hypothetical protein